MTGRDLIDKEYSLTSRERRLVFDMKHWAPRGACQDEPDPGFLAERTNNSKKNHEQELRAKEICADCPVKIECLDHAVRMPERGGIWGGLNDAERDELIKRLKKMHPEMWVGMYDEH